ncbi:MarR family winged helix-turn-helix transcriptional regulator [Companilactobacillus formosensis]|uniref:MarR family winged helix-turn-helix transcriptional regulator n=1 Tax=Companilactobacillus formosensis TaxID=1617889 RepID=UPI0013C2C55A|nr:MarR family winged helix-turn-helix transcriptional regulator [Companilactobacillus formosensis]
MMLDPKTMIVFNVRDLSLHISRYIQSDQQRRGGRPFEDKDATDRVSRLQGMAVGFLYKNKDQQVIQKDIEKGMFISRSTASGLVKRMVKNGLIYSTPSANDARVKCLHLTSHALDIMYEIDKNAARTEKKLRQGIDEKDLDVFFKVLKQIKENTK